MHVFKACLHLQEELYWEARVFQETHTYIHTYTGHYKDMSNILNFCKLANQNIFTLQNDDTVLYAASSDTEMMHSSYLFYSI